MMNKEARQQLQKILHPMKPVVLIGQKGLTESVINEIDAALKAHESIKLKFSGWDKQDKHNMSLAICEKLQAEWVQSIGHTLMLHRKKNG